MGSPQILHKIMGHVAHKQGEPVANVADIMQVKILPKKNVKIIINFTYVIIEKC